jgi:hypothetical protein
MMLETDSRFPDPDLAYRTLIEAHRGLSDEESARLNTRLVLILANQIGDLDVLKAAVALAREGSTNGGSGDPLPLSEPSDTVPPSPVPQTGNQ